MDNVIVAISNFPCIYTIYQSYQNNDYLTTLSILSVSIVSFLSHLIENHKHGMSGIGFSKRASIFLNDLDVHLCILLAARLLNLYVNLYDFSIDIVIDNTLFFSMFILAFVFMCISEYDKYNPNLKRIYIVTHCIWHMTIFTLVGMYLNYFIYNSSY